MPAAPASEPAKVERFLAAGAILAGQDPALWKLTGPTPIEATIDHAGPMTATVGDNALLLEVIAGADGLDPRQYAPVVHPYTESLLAAVPVPDPAIRRKKIVLQGDVPSPVKPPPGCHFHTRCPYAFDRCKVEDPALREVKPGQLVACHLR